MGRERFHGFEVVIPLLAIGKAERAGRTKTGKPYIYNTRATTSFMKAVRKAVEVELAKHAACDEYPSKAAMALELVFFLPRPKNVDDKVRWPSMCKPDNSNVRKAVEDAMTGLVYEDDKQIVDAVDKKRFCAEGEEPSIRIFVWEAGNRFG